MRGLCHARTADGEAFTDEDVVNHMIFLMMAAHDTSTITTTAAAYFLVSTQPGRNGSGPSPTDSVNAAPTSTTWTRWRLSTW